MTSPPSATPPPPAPASPRPPAAALVGLALLGVLGGWLVAAPFALGDQPRGAAWTAATSTDVATGAALAGTAVLGLLGYLAAVVAWLARHGRRDPRSKP